MRREGLIMTTNIKAGPAINTGPYSFERDARPVWRDTNTGELCGFPGFADTQSTVMDAAELKADQMRAPAAPRIPRKRSPILSADSPDGTSRQGRDIPAPTEPISRISDEQIERLLMWLTATAAVMGAAACAYWTAVA